MNGYPGFIDRLRKATLNVDIDTAKLLVEAANVIEEKADPWKVADLPDACPECGEEYWHSPKTGERYLRPLIVRYKEGDTMLENAEAMCRFCDKKFGVRELSYELAQLREALGASA